MENCAAPKWEKFEECWDAHRRPETNSGRCIEGYYMFKELGKETNIKTLKCSEKTHDR